jgi:hypothetical protein
MRSCPAARLRAVLDQAWEILPRSISGNIEIGQQVVEDSPSMLRQGWVSLFSDPLLSQVPDMVNSAQENSGLQDLSGHGEKEAENRR